MRNSRQFRLQLRPFMHELSAHGPYGGGSAAAATSAAAAALLVKALAYSRLKNSGSARVRLDRMQRDASELLKQSLVDVDTDATAFRKYLQERRPERKQQVLRRSSQVVLKVFDQSCAGIALIERCYKDINRNIFSDIMISFLLFMASAQASCVNLRINNRYVKKEVDRIDIASAEKRAKEAALLQKKLKQEFHHGKNP